MTKTTIIINYNKTKMKKQLLMKTLLVAVCLGGANFGWADDLPTPVYLLDFEEASTVSDFGGVQHGSGSLLTSSDASFGKYYQNMPNATEVSTFTNFLEVVPSTNPWAAIKSSGSNAFTICFWCNAAVARENKIANEWGSLFTGYTSAGTAANRSWYYQLGPDVRCRGQFHYNNYGYADNNHDAYLTTAATWMNDDDWHHFAWVLFGLDGTTSFNLKLYIDGTQIYSVDESITGANTTGFDMLNDLDRFVIGGASPIWADPDNAFGYDDIALYSSALSADQVAAIIDNKLYYDYTVNAVDGSDNVLQKIATGKVSKGSSATVYYPQYINVNGTLYSISANGSYPYYGTTFTPDADNYVKKITYTNTGISVLYFKEGEDLFTNATSTYFASQSKMGYTSNSNSTTYVATTTLPAGTYTIHARFVNSNASAKTTNFRVGSENIVYTYAVSASSQPTVSQEFTITEAGTLYVACEGSSTTGVDWFYITGTPAYTVLGDPYYGTRGDYWNYKTNNATVNAGTSYSYKFINHNVTGNNWDNFLLPVYHYNDGNKHDALQLRADWYEGANGKGNVGFDLSADYYLNTISILDGATIDMTVFYTEDNSFRMESVITTSAGAKKYYNYNLANYKTTGDGAYDYSALFSSLEPVPSSIQTALGANWCWLEVIKEAGAIATTNALGYTTFSNINKLDLDNLPEGLKAYYALDNDVSDDYVTLTEATGVVPGETGLILKGEANTVYEIPTSISEATALSGNLLVACPYRETVSSGENKYVLVNNSGTMEFQSLEEYGATIPTGKAYLNANSGAGARLSIVFEDEGATAIKDIDASNNSGAQAEGKYLEKGKIVILKNGVKFNTNGQKIK